MAVLPAALVCFELIFRAISVQSHWTGYFWLSFIMASLAGGLLLDMLCSVFKSEKLNGWLGFVVLQITALCYMLSDFLNLEFGIYMGVDSIFGGAKGVSTEAWKYIITLVAANWLHLVLLELPVLVYLFLFLFFKFPCYRRFKGTGYIQILLLCAIFEAGAAVPLCNMSPSWEYLTSEFDYDSDVRSFNFQTATKLDLIYFIFGNPWKKDFILLSEPQTVTDTENYNIMNLNLDSLMDKESNINIKKIHQYVQTLTPSEKNEYTGLFKGKNLIQITAESFTPYVLDEELTPVLYKLANSGIIFKDYYQPLWSGSTTTGEFQILTGLLPANGYYSMMKTAENNMYFTVGNQFLRLGYNSIAYHNGTNTYFNRHLTHENLGYSSFIANGSGMTGLSGIGAWPQSDVEMMEFAIPQFINTSPFNIYFMTLSGHSKYDRTNFIVRKNIDEVEAWAKRNNKEYTDAVKSYLAGNLEFEKAMEYLLYELEQAGVLDNTVILITGDHYPYSLSDDYEIDDETHHVTYYGVEDNLENLFGFMPQTQVDFSHNSLIIWTPSLDDEENHIIVNEPVSSIDILPTLSNLFGFEFDSRMFAGRDVFAENTDPLVIFSNYSWLTDKGYYDSETRLFTPKEGITVDDNYVKTIKTIVQNKMVLSQNIPLCDYYASFFGKKEN